MVLSHNESVGYISAFISCIASGSFAVPIKVKTARQVDVDPLVLQTYKLGAAFLTSWLVLLAGVKFSFTPLGFVSGLFVVPGGTAGYYAVQNAGLATAQGIWCSCKVIVAFIWGMLIFGEPVKTISGTLLSIVCLVSGLVGMSLFSARESTNNRDVQKAQETELESISLLMTDIESTEGSTETGSSCDEQEYDGEERDASGNEDEPLRSHFQLPVRLRYQEPTKKSEDDSSQTLGPKRRKVSHRFAWGVIAALIDGGYGGSLFVPMHYAKSEETKGLSFLISFAVGCSTVMAAFWLMRFIINITETKSIAMGWSALPSFHFKTVGPYAFLAGIIWSIGNASCILSVSYLGQGLGYSIVQSQLLIAGLWGIFCFKEIQNFRNIWRWFASAFVTLIGIFLLTREHVANKS